VFAARQPFQEQAGLGHRQAAQMAAQGRGKMRELPPDLLVLQNARKRGPGRLAAEVVRQGLDHARPLAQVEDQGASVQHEPEA